MITRQHYEKKLDEGTDKKDATFIVIELLLDIRDLLTTVVNNK